MTQVEGLPYRRHGPPAALREFLESLDPGDHFDCGRARLHGLDDVLLEEARRRGRAPGDDAFQLVATDRGLIFCRPSIGFAIAARWEDLTITRPRGEDPVVLPVTWPRHGELRFTVSRRLAGNIFRLWLQLKMDDHRRVRRERTERFAAVGAGVGGSQSGTVVRSSGAAEARSETDVEMEVELELDAERDLGVFADDHLGFAPGIVEEPTADPILDPTAERVAEPGAGDEPGIRPAARSADGGDGRAPDLIATVDPDPIAGSSAGDGRPGTPAGVRHTGTILDEELERVVPPGPSSSPSWVGSAASLVGILVALSSVVLAAAVIVGLQRRPLAATEAGAPAGPVATAGPVTIDHERFRPSADEAAALDGAVVGPTRSESTAATGDDGSDRGVLAGESEAQPDGSTGDSISDTAADPASDTRSDPAADTGADPDDEDPEAIGGTGDIGDEAGSRAALAPLRCDANYSGCVPAVSGLDAGPGIAADVDCAGRGDGPWFVEGEIVVMGSDVFGLDTDGDGRACEADQPDEGTDPPPSTVAPTGTLPFDVLPSGTASAATAAATTSTPTSTTPTTTPTSTARSTTDTGDRAEGPR